MSQQSFEPIVKRLSVALLGGLYGLFLLYLGRRLTGAGHGTVFFAMLGASPLGFGLLIWPCLGFVLVGNLGRGMRLLLVTLLSLHYAGLGWWIVFVDQGWSYIARCAEVLPLIVITVVVVYLGGQIAIWYFLLRRCYRPGRSGDAMSA